MKLPIILSILALTLAGTADAGNNVFRKPENSVVKRNTINPKFAQNKARKAVGNPEGTVLFENFEEWDGSEKWVPEGWTFNHKVTPAGHPGWRAYPYDAYDPDNYPSTTYIFYSFYDSVDEWLISPEFTIGEGMIFSADCYNGGTYYFDMEVEMWTSEITSIKKVNDFIINITTDGGETWTPLYSIPDEMLKQGYTKMYEYWDHSGWETIQLPLDKYVGKKAQIAFQIVGDPIGMPDKPDSQSSGVDNIVVGLPKVDVSYKRPIYSLYYGLTNFDAYVPGTFMVVPVHTPVTFKNSSEGFGATYSWSYEHTDGMLTSENQKELEVVYGTNHESEVTSRNNIYDMPVLSGRAEGFASTEFVLPGFLQAGGRGEYQIHYTDGDIDETEWLQLGLSIADPQIEYTRTYADFTVPYFGYNGESDRFWTTKVFDISNNEYDKNYRGSEKNWSKLVSIGNIFHTADAPIVIEKIRTNAYGRGTGINGYMPNAKFTAEIYFLDEKYNVPETPAYSVECKGNDITIVNRSDTHTNHFIALNFKFEEPIVITREDCPAYLVAISGFNDEANIEYFSPEMSAYDNPDGLALGWAATETCWGGYMLPKSWKPVYEQTSKTEPAGERLISFYIMLDAAYPWLVGGEDELTITSGESVKVELDSYYDGSELRFEGLPEWLSATATGKYDKTVVTFTAAGDVPAEGAVVKIVAPGVSKEIKFVGDMSGITTVSSDRDNGPAEYFNLQGIRIERPEKGQVVIKREGNRTEKVIVK